MEENREYLRDGMTSYVLMRKKKKERERERENRENSKYSATRQIKERGKIKK